MPLEDTLENLDKTLTRQNEINDELARSLRETTAQTVASNYEIVNVLEAIRKYTEDTAGYNAQFASSVTALERTTTESAQQASRSLQESTNQIQTSARTFLDAANETSRSVNEFGELVRLAGEQLKQQSESLKLQNLAIETQIRLARESSRSSWVQNGLFFFLGILIPIIVQFIFKLL